MLRRFRFKMLLIVIIISVVLLPFIFVSSKLSSLENEVVVYLMERGYGVDEIGNTETAFGKLPTYSVWVTFADEPQFKYQYIKSGDRVMQLSYTVTNIGRNAGKMCLSMMRGS
ncbi:DUF3139 domain-containing protein [Sutcliffiella cohnii]